MRFYPAVRWFLIALFIASCLYFLHEALAPFFYAFLLAYLCNPLALRLEKKGLKRTQASIASFAIIALFIFIFILIILPLIGAQLLALFEQLPQYIIWFKDHVLIKAAKALGLKTQWNEQEFIAMLQENAQGIRAFIAKLMGNILGSAAYLISFFSYVFLVPFIAFYFLRDWHHLLQRMESWIPRKYVATIRTLSQRCDWVLSGFFQGQFLVMLALSLLYSLGLGLMGLDMALGIGILSGLLSFIPYLGLIVGMSFAILLALFQFQDFWHPLAVILVFAVCQSIEAMYLTPKLVGDRTGLHPLAVLFAIMAGGQCFGFSGILWALPVAAMMNVFLDYFKHIYLKSHLYLAEEESS